MVVIPSLEYFVAKSSKATITLEDNPPKLTLGIDPGGTTGVCAYEGINRLESSQLNTKTLDDGIRRLKSWLNSYYIAYGGKQEIRIICEDYRVYSWHAEDHAWRELHTPKLIGAIHCICQELSGIKLVYQMAQHGKSFITDDKLKAWGLYDEGLQHARDANRHALNFILFGHLKDS